jgi:16S rRNA (adenine1518-N6/adenine1519-N6)-dimethyltransferase
MESPRSILKRHGLWAKKSWGQCFLVDEAVVTRIVETVAPSPDQDVVEIGAGLGSLTLALAQRAARVHAIERDRDLVKVLHQELAGTSAEVVEANALTYDFTAFTSPVKVVGNLPYNIASPLLFHLLDQGRSILAATIMLQREVAERIVAGPGSRTYGVPSVLCQQEAEVGICFDVPRTAFHPQPRVDSTVIQLRFRERPQVEVAGSLFKQVVKAAFSARRKQLRNALTRAFEREHVVAVLANTGIDGGRRGETLTVLEFGELARAMEQLVK